MRQELRDKLEERRNSEMAESIETSIKELESEGYKVEFGEIGTRSTYALLTRGEEEIVGYTYVRELRFKNELTGRYRALQQAIIRKSLGSDRNEKV